MKIEQLICFQTVKRYCSFTKASDELFNSQSALSKHIKSLEEELGSRLFTRNRNKVELTPLGKSIEEHVEHIIKEYNNIVHKADFVARNGQHKKLCIASLYNANACGIAEVIVSYERRKTLLRIETFECGHAVMPDLLKEHRTDICIGYSELWDKNRSYNVTPLRVDALVLVANKNHAFSKLDAISLAEAAGEKFCFPREDTKMFEYIYNNCVLKGFAPELTNSNVRLGIIKQYIRAGLRCTILVEPVAKNVFYEPDFALIRLNDVEPLTLSLLYDLKRLDEIGRDFVDFAKRYFENAKNVGI